jgi:AraC-like DNA-binding protein
VSALPRVLRIRPASHATDRTSHLIAFALEELRAHRTGGDVVRLRMAELLFVDAVRHYLETLPGGETGWLAGLGDPLIARALALLHKAPGRGWTLEELAVEAATSRSVLADRFMHVIGQAPMQYLRQLRMQLACRLLAEEGTKVASVAGAVGFESEAAFSRSFKKCVGLSPTAWRRQHAL